MKKILVHYPFIPAYRIPVFNCLAKEQDVEVVFLSAKDSGDPTLLAKESGWEFNHIQTSLKSFEIFKRKLDFEFGVVTNLIKRRGENTYYIILSNPNILSSWVYSLLAKLLGYNVIFWGHGLLREDHGLKKVIRGFYYKIPNKYWLYGSNGKQLLIKNGIPGDKIKVIYNSLDYDMQKKIRVDCLSKRLSIRLELGYSENEFVIVTIGRLLKKLRIDQIIEAIPKSSLVKLKLIVIGDGPEKESLENLCIELGVSDSVSFTGAVYDEKILGKYYTASDASVVMGIVGLAAMHSLAYGIPMITHSNIEGHCPEIEAVIPGVTGEFFEQNSIDSFLDSVYKVNDNKGNYRNNCIQEIEKRYTPSKQVGFMMESLNDEL
jgi:glycosyltransferase involved in cell wall biosynthesis